MSTINELTHVSELEAGDNLLIYSASAGDTRRASMSELIRYVGERFGLSGSSLRNIQYITASAAPFEGGDPVDIGTNRNVHMVLQPSTTLNAATINMPSSSIAEDGQEVIITSTEYISYVIYSGNGSTVRGADSQLNVDSYIKFRYVKAHLTWYRVG